MAKLVRIKPYDAKKGHLTRRYTAFSTRFDESRGWYRVGDDVAEYLATVRQVPGDEDTPLVFDVCSETEARGIEEAEHKKVEERAQAANANVARPHDTGTGLSTRDLSPRELLAARAAARTEARSSRRAERTG